MNEVEQIKNPSITLYPFHLRDDRDESDDQVAKNAQNLWENLADNVGKEFDINELKSLRDKLNCYKNGHYEPDIKQENLNDGKLLKPDGKTLNFQPITQPDGQKLNGSIYPQTFGLKESYLVVRFLSMIAEMMMRLSGVIFSYG